MQIRFAAIGGVDIDSDLLEHGVHALAERGDFEEVPFGPETFYSIRIHPPWIGDRSTWAVVEIEGEDSVSTLVDVARFIATHTNKEITAVASGIEREKDAGRIELGYRAYEIAPDGSCKTITNERADEICALEADEDSLDELGDLLSILVGDSAVHATRPANSGRCFRRKPLFEDARLSRLASSILAAKSVSFAPEPKDRIRLNLESHDGTKQISLVSIEEAEQLRKATSR